jgi:hypothetical protein
VADFDPQKHKPNKTSGTTTMMGKLLLYCSLRSRAALSRYYHNFYATSAAAPAATTEIAAVASSIARRRPTTTLHTNTTSRSFSSSSSSQKKARDDETSSSTAGRRRREEEQIFDNNDEEDDAVTMTVSFDAERFLSRLRVLAPAMAASLAEHGYWTNFVVMDEAEQEESMGHDVDEGGTKADEDDDDENMVLVTTPEVMSLRLQAIALRAAGRFEPSWSEKIDASTNMTTRFDKPGVYACEPDGADYEDAPDLLQYMSTVIRHLPPLLNAALLDQNNDKNPTETKQIATNTKHDDDDDDDGIYPAHISNQAFNAKLAVTLPGGSVYPLHVDNPTGTIDTRKLTCILYLNPIYAGGDLRLRLLQNRCVDLSPRAGRVVLFWSDEIPHEVLPCAPDVVRHNNVGDDAVDEGVDDDAAFDRYALTIWWPDIDPHKNVHRPGSKFEPLRVGAFAQESWC